MAIRPIDLARKLQISTTTIRTYEALGLLPPVPRSAAGYRLFTEEHAAYLICIREMLAGFSLTLIGKILNEVMAQRMEVAFWLVTKAQADLQQDKLIAEKIMQKLVEQPDPPGNPKQTVLTVHAVSRETGVPVSTIRYWDKVGLLTVKRSKQNNYRLFTATHIRQILTIYALKLSLSSTRYKHSVAQVKAELRALDQTDTARMRTIATEIMQQLAQTNRAQLRGIAALYHLGQQVESDRFDAFV